MGLAFAIPLERGNCRRVHPSQSIQEAIDQAHPGDRIEVYAGTYNEQLTIQKDGIKLIAKKGVVLKPPAHFSRNACSGLSQTTDKKDTEAGICIQGRGVTFGPYEQEHRKILSVGNFVNNVSVTGFTVIGFDGENIAAIGAYNTAIYKNTLVDGGQYGFLSVGCKGTRVTANQVSTSTINFIGISANDYSDALLSENHVTGYFTALVSETPGGIIRDNKVTNVCVGAAADPGVSGTSIINNQITLRNPGCDKIYKIYGAGVVVYGATETLVKDNHIEKFNNGGLGVGIYLLDAPAGETATKNVVKNNFLRNNDVDIYDNSKGMNSLGGNSCTVPSVPVEACI
ncbi:pectin lyase fold/virulence factor [Phaeosphaeriaceae sp. PMI808]|nr:pectin lyase fold/virulence factor [Phaeosphaeriaceae sp. PMI808]